MVLDCTVGGEYLSQNMRGQGQSGQAIKLSEIALYINDFPTINNPGF